jgi:pectate lyase
MQWGGQNATFHHNLLAHNHNRTPRFNGARSNDINVLIDYVNNVNYNWGKANSCYGSDIENTSNKTNFVNNYYKPGPARPGTSSSYFTQSSFSSSQTTAKIALWYMNGNYMEGSANTAKNADNYLGLDAGAYVSKGILATALRSETPFEITYPVTAETAEQAYESVLAGAGAFPRDAVDLRIANEVRTGTTSGSGVFGAGKGIIDNPDAVGGYPEYQTYNTVVDADHDGMDDAWEAINGLNPSDAEDRNKKTQLGYTALEVYLNSLAGETIDLAFTAIRKIENENSLKITKAGNQLYVASGQFPVSEIRIFNPAGQTMIMEKGTIASVDISGLPAGIYIAEARSADNRQKVLKFNKYK